MSAERKRLALLNNLRHYLNVRREKTGSASKFEFDSQWKNEVVTSANDGGRSPTISENKSKQVNQKTVEDMGAQVITTRDSDAAITRIETTQKQFAEEIRIRMEAIERSLSELIKRLPSVNNYTTNKDHQ